MSKINPMNKVGNFEYDARLTDIPKRDVCPSVVHLVSKETGLRFVPARISGVSETGDITEYTIVTQIGLGFRTTTIPATDLKYFGLQPLHLPESVIVNGKVEIPLKKEQFNEPSAA